MTRCVWIVRLFTVLSVCWTVQMLGEVIIQVPQSATSNFLIDILFSEDLFDKYYACLFGNDTKVTCKAKTTYTNRYTVSDIFKEEQNIALNTRIVICSKTPQSNGGELVCTRADDNVDLSQGDVTYFRPFDASTCANSSLCAGILWYRSGSIDLAGSTNFEYCTDTCEETTVSTSTLSTVTTSTTTAITTITTQSTTTTSPTAPTPSSGPSTSTTNPDSLVSPTTNIPDTNTTNSHSNATATGDNIIDDDDDGDVDEELIYIIVGTICGVLVLIIIVVIVVICVRRQRRRDSKRIAQARRDTTAAPIFMFENKAYATDVEFMSTDFRANSSPNADTVDKDVDQMYPKVNESAGNSKLPNNVMFISDTQGREANNGQSAMNFDTVISLSDQSPASHGNSADNRQFPNHIYNVSTDDNIDNKNNDDLFIFPILQNDVENLRSDVFDTEIVNDYTTFGDVQQPFLPADSHDSRLTPTLVYTPSDDDMLSPEQRIKGDYAEPDEPPVYATVNKGRNRDHDMMITVL